MKTFETPVMEIVILDNADIITASTDCQNDFGEIEG